MKKLKILLSLFLVLLISASSLPLAAYAQETPFKTHIISLDSGKYFEGDFLLKNGEVYISKDAVLEMAFISYTREDEAVYMEKGSCEAVISSENVIDFEGKVFLPFIEIMEELCLNTDMPTLGTLMVKSSEDTSGLVDLMRTIHLNKEYNMSDWQNLEYLSISPRDLDVWTCVLMDITTNFKSISYATGTAQRNQYEKAFEALIKPTETDDLKFEKQTLSTAKTIGEYNKAVDGISGLLFGSKYGGFLGGIGTVCEAFSDAAEIMQVDDIINSAAYTKSAKDVEESIIRAVSHISSVKGTPTLISDAGTLTLESYNKNELSIWEYTAINIVQDAPDLLGDMILEKIFANTFWVIKAANKVILSETQEQIEGTIMASRFLDIQNECKKNYFALKSNYNKASAKSKPNYLQMMYDMTNLYLLSGIRAWSSTGVDEDSKEWADSRVSMIQSALNDLRAYTPEDIFLPVYVRNIAEQLKECAATPFEDFEKPETSELREQKPSVIVTWDNKEVDDVKLNLLVSMEGELSNGSTFVQEFHEGTYYSPDEIAKDPSTGLVATTIRHDEYWETVLERPNGTFIFTVAPENEWPLGTTITAVNPVVTVKIPGQNDVILAAEDYLTRSSTGVWCYYFVIENGKIC